MGKLEVALRNDVALESSERRGSIDNACPCIAPIQVCTDNRRNRRAREGSRGEGSRAAASCIQRAAVPSVQSNRACLSSRRSGCRNAAACNKCSVVRAGVGNRQSSCEAGDLIARNEWEQQIGNASVDGDESCQPDRFSKDAQTG